MEIIKKASELFGSCKEFALASINDNGYPRICVLEFTSEEATLWIDGEFLTLYADGF